VYTASGALFFMVPFTNFGKGLFSAFGAIPMAHGLVQGTQIRLDPFIADSNLVAYAALHNHNLRPYR